MIFWEPLEEGSLKKEGVLNSRGNLQFWQIAQPLSLQHTTTHCSILQHTTTHTAAQCSTAPRAWRSILISSFVRGSAHIDKRQHTATHCNTLQPTVICCNKMQHAASYCKPQGGSTLHHTATHCNTLQHTATHRNTLQHTATHCNTLQHGSSSAHIDTQIVTPQHTVTHCNTLQHTTAQTTTHRHAAHTINLCHAMHMKESHTCVTHVNESCQKYALVLSLISEAVHAGDFCELDVSCHS